MFVAFAGGYERRSQQCHPLHKEQLPGWGQTGQHRPFPRKIPSGGRGRGHRAVSAKGHEGPPPAAEAFSVALLSPDGVCLRAAALRILLFHPHVASLLGGHDDPWRHLDLASWPSVGERPQALRSAAVQSQVRPKELDTSLSRNLLFAKCYSILMGFSLFSSSGLICKSLNLLHGTIRIK